MTPTSNLSEQEREMVANIRQSSHAASKALYIFHQALVTAGMKDGISSYRTMCDTILSQRLWMLDREDEVAYRNFEELHATAFAIVEILEPYTRAFKKLSALPSAPERNSLKRGLGLRNDAEEPDGDRPQGDESVPAEETVIRFLRSYRKRSSATKIRLETGLHRKDLDSALERLRAEGRIVGKRVGGRDMFEFAEQPNAVG